MQSCRNLLICENLILFWQNNKENALANNLSLSSVGKTVLEITPSSYFIKHLCIYLSVLRAPIYKNRVSYNCCSHDEKRALCFVDAGQSLVRVREVLSVFNTLTSPPDLQVYRIGIILLGRLFVKIAL